MALDFELTNPSMTSTHDKQSFNSLFFSEFATKHHSITLLLYSSIIYINGIARHDILSLIARERSHRNQSISILFHSLLLQNSFQDFSRCSLRVTRELKKVSSNSDRVTLQLIFHLIHFAHDFLCPKFLGYLKTRSDIRAIS
jgi:hypothetical protein